MTVKEMFRKEKFFTDLSEMFGLPIFDIDISKDEIDENESFFIYYENGPIRKDGEGNLQRDFTLMYLTKTNHLIDDFAIIDQAPKWGLRFRDTEYDVGKISNTQTILRTTTFNMHQVVRIC